jgi:hypothetical protein
MPQSTNRGRLRNDNIDQVFQKLEGGNKPSSGVSQFDWHYPYELTSAESQHFILFTCYAEGPASFETKIIKKKKGRGGSLLDTLSSSFGGGGAAGMVGGILGAGGSNEDIVTSGETRIGAKRDLQPQESIALYMTPQVAYQQKTDWEMTETQKGGWGGWFGDMLAGLGQGLMDFTEAGGENNRLAANGEAKNPNKEALFKEMSERSFSFDFTFVPKSEEETEAVHQIIRIFRYNAAPKLQSRRYFDSPGEFEIKFFSGGRENPYMPKLRRLVCTSVDHKYGGSEVFRAFDDGAPAEVKMSLSFMEVEQLHKEHISYGF